MWGYKMDKEQRSSSKSSVNSEVKKSGSDKSYDVLDGRMFFEEFLSSEGEIVYQFVSYEDT